MEIKIIPIKDIKERSAPQREKPKGVNELAASIEQVGLLHPIILADDNTLLAGRNRIEAYKVLGRDEIPATYRKDLSKEGMRLVELDENVRRADLTWQEFCYAISDLRDLLREVHPKWDDLQCAEYAGYTDSYFYKIISVATSHRAGVSTVVNAGNLTVALNAVERNKRRQLDNETNEMWEVIEQSNKETKIEGDDNVYDTSSPLPKKKKPNKIEEILCGDFDEWAAGYTGPKFNLLHCDFPYGIEHGKSGQGGAKTYGAYDDSPDVYWSLLRSLANRRDRLLYPSAHIIFWFSMRYYHETLDFFAKEMPEMEVNYNPLIWHKTDNKGIIRDTKHTPRHVYETAFFITRGNREIIKSVGDCYGAPTQKSKATHISEKPVPVLRHFMQLCCDSYSELLDPTCGGGSALRAADGMGAKRVLGIELNEEYANDAKKQLMEQRGMKELVGKYKED